MQFVLDCVTTLLIAVLCFFMLFQKYEIKCEKLIFRTVALTGNHWNKNQQYSASDSSFEFIYELDHVLFSNYFDVPM